MSYYKRVLRSDEINGYEIQYHDGGGSLVLNNYSYIDIECPCNKDMVNKFGLAADEAQERLTEMMKEDPWAGDVTIGEVQDEMDYERRREKDYDLAQERLTEMIKEDPWAGDVTVNEVLDEME